MDVSEINTSDAATIRQYTQSAVHAFLFGVKLDFTSYITSVL